MKKEGYFGNFGGRFVPEALRPPLMELEEAMNSIMPPASTGTRSRICWSITLGVKLPSRSVPAFRKNWASACG